MSYITDSVPLKKFLGSFYHFDFYVEKQKSNSGEKIFIFSKSTSLPESFIKDLKSYNKDIKVRNRKIGMSLRDWKDFVNNVSASAIKSLPKNVCSAPENYNSEVKQYFSHNPENGNSFSNYNNSVGVKNDSVSKEAIFSFSEEINGGNLRKDYWQMTREEFLLNPPKAIELESRNGALHLYELEKDGKGFLVFKDGKVIISITGEALHERLICKALKDGLPVDSEKVQNDYPYFLDKCKKEEKVNPEEMFVAALHEAFNENKKLNKRDLEKLGAANGITEVTKIFELAEYSWIKWYRNIAFEGKDSKETYESIVDFYTHIQPTFSLRDSVRVEFQQYSTPAPIAYLAQLFCRVDQAELIFEPSAGNGLLVFATPYENTIVNELDRERLENLQKESFKEILNQDAELPFTELKGKVDALLTNPPFGRLSETIRIDGYQIKALDHSMVAMALETLKDKGRAAIIIGGHTNFTEDGMIRSFRVFFNWLFHFYHVSDIININGDLYAKQGTSFDIRLILVAGRKQQAEGFAPMIKEPAHPLKQTVNDFEELYARVNKSIQNLYWLFPKEKIKAESKEAIKIKNEKPVHEISLYEFGTSDPLSIYPVKRVVEIDLQVEAYYRLAHKANFQGEQYYVMGWKKHYNKVLEALKQGIKVDYDVVEDYPDLLKKYRNLYGEENRKANPTFEQWVKNILIVSIGKENTTLFSSLNGSVYASFPTKQWKYQYEKDEVAQNKLYRELYHKYCNPLKSTIPATFQGELILLLHQLTIANQVNN